MDGLWHATPSPLPPPPMTRSKNTPTSTLTMPSATAGSRASSRADEPLTSSKDVVRGEGGDGGGGGGGQGKGMGVKATDGLESAYSHRPAAPLPPAMNAAGVAASISSSLVMVSFDIPHLVR